MTLTITLKNSTNATIHLKSFLKNTDNFMFAGNTQVHIVAPFLLSFGGFHRTENSIRFFLFFFPFFNSNFQLNISLFAKSTYNLLFNLYPLKAGWQQLPEFEIRYNTPDDVTPEKRADEEANNLQLKMLVHRWMPKRVFILVSPKIHLN